MNNPNSNTSNRWTALFVAACALVAASETSAQDLTVNRSFEPGHAMPVEDVLKEASEQLDERSSWALLSERVDHHGVRHQRFQHEVSGYPVVGSLCTVHSRESREVSSLACRLASGRFTIPATRIPAGEAARLLLESDAGRSGSPDRNPIDLFEATVISQPQLVLAAGEQRVPAGQFYLAYQFERARRDLAKSVTGWVTADGRLLRTLPLSFDYDAIGTAETLYSRQREITTLGNEREFWLEDWPRRVKTVIARGIGGTVPRDEDNDWSASELGADQIALDAHWGAESATDYYLDQHGWLGWDGAHATVFNVVRYRNGWANAMWFNGFMAFGDGNAESGLGPMASLDIVGHEFTHGVVTSSSNLDYRGESGALHESFADIFGTLIEFDARPGRANWVIGEDISFSGLPGRSLGARRV